MTTRTIDIPEEQERFIRDAVDTGRFQDENEVVRAALQLLEQEEEEYRENLEILRAEVQKGFDDIEAGRYTELNSREEISDFFAAFRSQQLQYLAKEDNGAQA